MIIDKEKLIQILYSNYKAGIDYYTINELIFLLNNKCLYYHSEIISNIDGFNSFIDKINNKEIDTFDIEGSGNRHLALKLLGFKNYKKLYKNINIENWFQGYKPDLLFKNNRDILIIECGDTNLGIVKKR